MRRSKVQIPLGRDKLIRAVLMLGAVLVAFSYGVGVGVCHWPPYSAIRMIKTSLDRVPPGHHATQRDSYTVQTRMHSYFRRDDNGGLKLRAGLPYKSEQEYILKRTIRPDSTAVIIMDPWVDMAADDLNAFFGKVTEYRIIPLAKAAIRGGHPIIILTNDPRKVKYNARIHSGLEALVQAGDAMVLYHQDADDRQFASLLRSIHSDIYNAA